MAKDSTPSQQEKDKERVQLARSATLTAFAFLQLLNSGGKTHFCPSDSCKGHSPKVKIFENGDFHCRRCGLSGGPASKAGVSKSGKPTAGNAIDLLMSSAKLSFVQAVALLVDGTTPDGDFSIETPEVDLAPAFQATLDSEVYDFLLDNASLEAAQEFYALKGILPDAVALAKARFITDPISLASKLLEKFGKDRIVEAGLTSEKGRLLFSNSYPVVEPQLLPNGSAANLQFRCSLAQAQKVAAHKLNPAENKFVPKFMSLRGATPAHRPGYGAHLLATYPKDKKVWIGEGGQDFMAGLSMGLSTFCLPGTSTRPPEDVTLLLGRHSLVVAFDADKGGDSAREGLDAFFTGFGICDMSKALQVVLQDEQVPKGLKSLARNPQAVKSWPGFIAAVAKASPTTGRVLKGAKWREDKGLTYEHRRPPEGMDLTDVLQSKR